MTIETYPAMNAKIVDILRIDYGDPALLYAAQRIEELELIAGIRGKCLEITMEALEKYFTGEVRSVYLATTVLAKIKARLVELEPGESTQ